ncbi:CYFA0S11e01816g1_1 [Cyberlindnera fabianii]|uniref:CYFA0S11e01816g1_1 n=1 Tax=Cyberlindnera fabianii TaxID=36022 RepID=A0A061B149_CYBFA|nr:CYFA0S11e01816g1_1 [Cyberlindnera fabianii]
MSDTRWDGIPIINYDFSADTTTLNQVSLRPKAYKHLDSIEWAHEYERHRELKVVSDDSSMWNKYIRKMSRWIVLIGTGVLIGVLTSSLDYSYEWATDLKDGICRDGFYFTKRHCCAGIGDGVKERAVCESWATWADVTGIGEAAFGSFLYKYFVFILTSVILAASAAYIVKDAPFVRTSGIAEMKTIISGVVLEDFLNDKTMIKKLFGLGLGVSANLWIGKEGPLVHIACVCADMLIRVFPMLDQNEAKRRELLLAATAAGISTAFNAPISGVIFTLEQLTSYFSPSDKMWISFFCAMSGVVVLNAFKEGINIFVEMNNQWLGLELPGFVLLGVMGGFYGRIFSKFNMRFARMRKELIISRGLKYEMLEVVILAFVTSVVCYPLVFPRLPLTVLIRRLYQDCDVIDENVVGDLCSAAGGYTLASLITSGVVATLLTAYTFGTILPAGVLMPSLAIGAIFGRVLGIFMEKVQQSSPFLTDMCSTSPELCISPGAYAVVGSAAFLAGTTKMTVWVVVTVFELTGALSYVLPIMITVIVARWTNDKYDTLNCYDQWIKFFGYPYLIEVNRPLPLTKASEVMKKLEDLEVVYVEDHPTVGELEHFTDLKYQGVPILKSRDMPRLVGWIGTSDLQEEYFRIHASSSYNSHKLVSFDANDRMDDDTQRLSFLVEHDHIILSPDIPLPSLVEVFFKMKPRFVMFCKDGLFVGLITLKDITNVVENA